MSRSSTRDYSSTVHSTVEKVRHSKEDALDEREFELLVDGTYRLDDPYRLQSQFVVLVAGRLGLRLGEITHFRAEWVDWRKGMVVVPRHQPCEKGQGGGICGLCRQQAHQQVEHNEGLAIEDVRPQMWRAKTDAAQRSIPFGFDPRVEMILERFCDEYDRWPLSHTAVRRRLERAGEAADGLEPNDLYPHCLRATCASYLAGKGLSGIELKGMLGWKDTSTGDNYVSQSPENLSRALHQTRLR